MTMMPFIHTRSAQYPDPLVAKPLALGGISKKARLYRDPPSTLRIMTVGALTLMPLVTKDFAFNTIVKKLINYSYHAVTSTPKVVIDANHRLAYPLGKNLEDIANGRMGKAFSYGGS